MKHKGELVTNCACIFIFLLLNSFICVTLPVTSQGTSELMCVEGVCVPKQLMCFLFWLLIYKSAASEVIT